MKHTLYVVVDSVDPSIVESVKEALRKLGDFHFSPDRIQASLDNCLEFYATIESDHWESLLSQLNKYWTIEDEQWMDYGFNTPMFHPHVYYLEIKE